MPRPEWADRGRSLQVLRDMLNTFSRLVGPLKNDVHHALEKRFYQDETLSWVCGTGHQKKHQHPWYVTEVGQAFTNANGSDGRWCRSRDLSRSVHTSDPLDMWQESSITKDLSDHLWHRTRLKFMTRFTVALLQRTTTGLWAMAVASKGSVQPASNHRRIQRFLSDYDVDFAMLGRLIAHLLPE